MWNPSHYPTDQIWCHVLRDIFINLPTEGLKPTQEWSQASFGEEIYGLSLVAACNLQVWTMDVDLLIYINVRWAEWAISDMGVSKIWTFGFIW